MQNSLTRLSGSLKGILMGVILFVASIGILYWNEGRVDISGIANDATRISATEQSTETDGQLVSLSGTIETQGAIGDLYLKEGDYIAIRRNVEMYAWDETSESIENNDSYIDNQNPDQRRREDRVYSYERVWTSNPDDSTTFEFPTQHQNPPKALPDETIKAPTATVGIYALNLDKAQLPAFQDITLTEEIALLDEGNLSENEEGMSFFETFKDIAPTLESNKYIFKGFGTLETPEIGDIRVSYSVVPSKKQVTVFGQQNGTEISTFIGPKNSQLYRIFIGTHEESLSQMTSEHTQSTWGLRVLGFVLMWISLGMLLGPISTILDFIPLVGDLSKSVIGIATFIVAAVLTTVVVMISMILHNLVALIVVVLLMVGAIVFILRQKAQSKTSTPSKPGMSKE